MDFRLIRDEPINDEFTSIFYKVLRVVKWSRNHIAFNAEHNGDVVSFHGSSFWSRVASPLVASPLVAHRSRYTGRNRYIFLGGQSAYLCPCSGPRTYFHLVSYRRCRKRSERS